MSSLTILFPFLDMYIFNVQAQDSEAMNLIGAMGDCQLVLTPEYEVQVVKLPRKQILCIWPFDSLKTFSFGGGLFSFTSGRHAPHGSGDFSFITSQDKLIHNTLQKLIDKARRNSTSSAGSSSRASISERPPAKLPQSSSSDSPSSNEGEEQIGRIVRSAQRTDNYYSGDTPPPPLPNQPPPKIPPKGANSKAWLHERYGGTSLEAEKRSGTLQEQTEEDGDHLYSKTIHFPQNKPVGDDPAIYNSLVHQGLGRKQSQDYDIAYPDTKAHTMNSDMYSVINEEKKPTTLPMEKPRTLPSTSDSSTPGGDMTANPLYGSSGNLLDTISSSTSPDTFSPSTSIISQEGMSTMPSIAANSVSFSQSTSIPQGDMTTPNVTANPVYVTSNVKKWPSSQNQTMPIEMPKSAPIDTPALVKNLHGYTQIAKQEDASHVVVESVDSDGPPPIPNRLYSESDQSVS